jgi:hypothetical protein
MPDSFPPSGWGPPPFDERDLEALLCGDTTETPVALRQVADALAALRAAPAQSELTGEAVARAEFRALVLDEGARTDGLPYAQVLSALTLDGAHRPPARHKGRPVRRRPRGTTRPVSRRGGALLGAGVLVLAVAVIALTGTLPGPFHGLVRSTAESTSAGTTTRPRPTSLSQSVSGTGTAEPKAPPTAHHSATPTPSVSPTSSPQTQARTLCRDYYGYFLRPRSPQSPDNRSGEFHLLGELSTLVGGRSRVYASCVPYLGGMFPQGMPPWAYPQAPGPQGSSGQPGTTGPGNSQPVPGNSGSGQERKTPSPPAP